MRQRQNLDQTYMNIAWEISKRSTCARREVGAVLVDVNNRIVATGHNGVPAGMEHCIDKPCEGARYPSGEGLNLCKSIHAEVNAIMNCRNVFEVQTVYLTVSPCTECIKVLMNTSAERIVFWDEYVQEGVRESWMNSMEGIRKWCNWKTKTEFCYRRSMMAADEGKRFISESFIG